MAILSGQCTAMSLTPMSKVTQDKAGEMRWEEKKERGGGGGPGGRGW